MQASEGPLSRKDAQAAVAAKVIGWLSTSSLAGLFGYEPYFTPAQQERWDWAVRDITARLEKLGPKKEAP